MAAINWINANNIQVEYGISIGSPIVRIYSTNLTSTSLGNVSVDLSSLTSLIEINLQNVGITSFTSILPNSLDVLDFSNNQITSFTSILPNSLRAISIGYNQLTSFTQDLPASLERLVIDFNKLTSFTQSLPNSLQALDLNNNRITSFTSILPASLTTLNISHNKLTSFTQDLPASLTFLDASWNLLTSFTQDLPASLIFLNISGDHISSFTQDLPASLKYLNISNTSISSFTQDLKNLEELRMNDIYLTSFTQDLKNLKIFHIENNFLTHFTQDLTSNNTMIECQICSQKNVTPTFTYPLPARFIADNNDCYVAPPTPPTPCTIYPPLPPLPCYCDSGLTQSYLDAYSAGNTLETGLPTIYCSLQIPDTSPGTPDYGIVFISSIIAKQVFSYFFDVSEDSIIILQWPHPLRSDNSFDSPTYTSKIPFTDSGAVYPNTTLKQYYGEPGLPVNIWDPTVNYSLIMVTFWTLWEGVTTQNAIDICMGSYMLPPGVYYMTCENQAIANAVSGTTYKWAMLI